MDHDSNEFERYIQNVEDITSTPMDIESIAQANNFKNFLISNYIQPDFIIEFCLILNYEKSHNGKLHVYKNFINPYVAVYYSLENVLTHNNISINLSNFTLYTVNTIKNNTITNDTITNDSPLQIVPVDYTQPPPLHIIFLPDPLDIHQCKNIITEWAILHVL